MEFLGIGTWQAASFMGFVVGLSVGLTGMGAGSFMMPFLLLGLGVEPVVAVGTNLLYGAATKIVGTWHHDRLGTVDWRKVGWLSLGSVPAALALSLLLAGIQSRSIAEANALVTAFLRVSLVLAAAVLFWRALGAAPSLSRTWLEGRSGRKWLVLSGAVVGSLVALTSIGSGTLLVPVLMFGTGLPMSRVVGTDLAHAILIALASSLVHLSLGNVSWPLLGALLMGSIPGVWIGSRGCVRVPDRVLKLGMASLLLAAGLKIV